MIYHCPLSVMTLLFFCPLMFLYLSKIFFRISLSRMAYTTAWLKTRHNYTGNIIKCCKYGCETAWNPRNVKKKPTTLNTASMPPAIKTENIGFACSSRISSNLPTFTALSFSAAVLFTLLKNRLKWIILYHRYILVPIMVHIDTASKPKIVKG